MNPKILVVSFTFPPYQDVGARRWTKFCKELTRTGYDVRAITFHFGKPSNTANWIKDTEGYKNRIDYFPSRYPRWLENPKSFTDKIMYRLSLLYVKMFSEGNYYDKASFTKDVLTRELVKRIDEGYNNIIVSCAPFKLAVWTAKIKKRYPHINFIVDFRDPWVDNKVLYGLQNMSDKRQKYETDAEKEVIDAADIVVSVADEMTDYFKSQSSNPNTKFITIKNGFDEDDFQNAATGTKRPDSDKGKLKLIFVGSIYNKAMHHVFELVSALDQLKSENASAYENIIFEFYGSYAGELRSRASEHKNMRFMGNIPHNSVFNKVKDADACMTFLTDEITYCFNTKFFEYLSQRKPILIFSKAGSASAYITENQLGYLFEPGSAKQNLLKVYNDFKENKLLNNPSFDISEFNVKNLAHEFEALLR